MYKLSSGDVISKVHTWSHQMPMKKRALMLVVWDGHSKSLSSQTLYASH